MHEDFLLLKNVFTTAIDSFVLLKKNESKSASNVPLISPY